MTLEYMGNKKLDILRQQNMALTEKLNGSMEIVKTWQDLREGYDKLHDRWAEAPKKILAADEPALTIAYIHWLTTENKFGMEFDFALHSVEPTNDISSFSFSISGEGEYHAIYDFIGFITKHPILYKIENIELSSFEETPDLIDFKLDIRGYFLNQKWELQDEFDYKLINLDENTEKYFDIFTALVKRPKETVPSAMEQVRTATTVEAQKPKDSELVNFKLLAISDNSVYMLSSKKQIVKIGVGETAYGGRLIKLDKQKSVATFQVTNNGQKQQMVLGID